MGRDRDVNASDAPVPTAPRFGRMLGRALTKGCPACGQRRQFKRWVIMADDCGRCGLHFERIEGHWIGAIGINTIVGFGTLALYLVVSMILTFPDFPVTRLMVGGVLVSIIVPTVFYPFSKTVWTAIDVAMRPLAPHEVNWMALDPDHDPAHSSKPHHDEQQRKQQQ